MSRRHPAGLYRSLLDHSVEVDGRFAEGGGDGAVQGGEVGLVQTSAPLLVPNPGRRDADKVFPSQKCPVCRERNQGRWDQNRGLRHGRA